MQSQGLKGAEVCSHRGTTWVAVDKHHFSVLTVLLIMQFRLLHWSQKKGTNSFSIKYLNFCRNIS